MDQSQKPTTDMRDGFMESQRKIIYRFYIPKQKDDVVPNEPNNNLTDQKDDIAPDEISDDVD